jgi:hypothetical protein
VVRDVRSPKLVGRAVSPAHVSIYNVVREVRSPRLVGKVAQFLIVNVVRDARSPKLVDNPMSSEGSSINNVVFVVCAISDSIINARQFF